MEPLVSIIVPIYNVEPYLRKCVDSIINQTYRNLEIILVDDGSTDNSPQICDEYKAKDSRVKVIHKPNGGLSDARNAGLDTATGEYVTFIDSDDYYHLQIIEKLIFAIQYEGVRISAVKNIVVDENGNLQGDSTETGETEILSSSEFIKRLCQKDISTSVCNKLFHRSFFETFHFKKDRLNEDFCFLSEIMMDEFKISCVDYIGYYYFKRQGSITHSGTLNSVLDSIQNIYDVLKMAEKRNKEDLIVSFIRLLLYQARTIFIMTSKENVVKNGEEYLIAKGCVDKYYSYLPKCKIALKDKLIIFGIRHFPTFSKRVIEIIR